MQHHDLDPSGDLLLIVGTDKPSRPPSKYDDPTITETVFPATSNVLSIRVSRRSMALSSPTWAAMFSPTSKWLESSSSELPLPDDDPDALLLLLRIAHLHFDLIPLRLHSSDTDDISAATAEPVPNSLLYRVAVLCDKYDCVRLVRPWIREWLRYPMASTLASPTVREDLFINWVFGGSAKWFGALLAEIIWQARLDEEGVVVMGEEGVLDTGVLAGETIDRILTVRTTALTAIDTLVRTRIARYSLTAPTCSSSLADGARRACDASLFGFLVLGLQEFIPLTTFSSKAPMHSLKDVYDAIVSVGGKIQVALMRDHSACNVARELQGEAAVICAERYVLTEAQTEHLRRQAEKCGNVMGES